MTLGPELVGTAAVALIATLGYLARQITNLEKKLGSVVCETLCKERSVKCQRALCEKLRALEVEDRRLWMRVNTHKHDDVGRVVIMSEREDG